MGKFPTTQYDLPKFRIGKSVMTPDGHGVVKKIARTERGHYYEVEGCPGYYHETELHIHLNGTKQ